MEKEEIDRRNNAIAEFMGAKVENREKYLGLIEPCAQISHYISCDLKSADSEWIPISRMKYHNSWDWIMDVVGKIELLGNYVTIERKVCGISTKYSPEEEKSGLKFIVDPIKAESKLLATFLAVSDFCLTTQTK